MAVNVKFEGDTQQFNKAVADMQGQLGQLRSSVDGLTSYFQSFNAELQGLTDKAGAAIGQIDNAFQGLTETINKGGAGSSSSSILVLLGGGALGVAAAGIAEAFYKVNEQMLNMDRNAREAAVSLDRFQELQYVLNSAGADSGKFASGLADAAKKLNDLSRDAGDLGKFLDANNVKWKNSAGEVISLNDYIEQASRLIADAANQQDRFKIGEILGLSKEWVRALQGGPVALAQLAQQAHDVGAVLDKETVQKAADFEREWKEASLQWSEGFKKIIVELTPYVTQFINFLSDKFGSWYNTWLTRMNEMRIQQGQAPVSSFTEHFTEPYDKAASALTGAMPLPDLQMSEAQWRKMADDARDMANSVRRAAEDSFPAKGAATKFASSDDSGDGARAAAMREIEGEIAVARQGLEQKKLIYNSDAQLFGLSQASKFGLLQQATQQEYETELALLEKEAGIDNLSVQQKAAVYEKIKALKAKHETEMVRLDTQSIQAQAQNLQKYADIFTSAFNSQLKGLITGTTSWSQAFKNILADMLVKFIEMVESMVVKWIVAEAAKTTATTTGAAARATAETAGSSVGLLAQIGNAVTVIMADAAKVFGGIFAFLAPALGPAAAGPAAAGSAAVAGAVSLIPALAVGTDYVLSPGLAFLHPGEAVIPAGARTSGAYTGGGMGAAPSLNVTISAIDTQTGYQFLQRQMPALARMLSVHYNRNPGARPGFA